jgi:acetyltransferase
VIRSDLKGHGLGWLLMQLIIEYAKSQNLKTLHREILQGKRCYDEDVSGAGLSNQDE